MGIYFTNFGFYFYFTIQKVICVFLLIAIAGVALANPVGGIHDGVGIPPGGEREAKYYGYYYPYYYPYYYGTNNFKHKNMNVFIFKF